MKSNYHETDQRVHVCSPRAYYVPFGTEQGACENREESVRFLSLNGVWKITAYKNVYLADGFWKEEGEKDILVPSCVQYFGYDYFQYTNYSYPFPFDPPRIPKDNPCYHFSKRVTLQRGVDEKQYLVFEGVDSCLYLFVNGQFVGFAQGSHRIHEFDITAYTVDGENKIDVLVLKWCFESYLEDQDKWRFTGIIRDVYILTRPSLHITDYKIQTDIVDGDGVIAVENRSALPITVRVLQDEITVYPSQTQTFLVKNPLLWSAETPFLYDVELTANGEKILERVGIRKVEIVDGIFKINGQPVKFYGVNRHDFHPEKGAAVSYADMENDIKLMKSLNVNALRTSHYPASPLLYQLCDRYGMYVMSESDVETHGSVNDGQGLAYTRGFDRMAEDTTFQRAVCLRQVDNVETHKNRACIVLWSLGNESGWGENFIQALKEVKSRDNRPVHYEGIAFVNKEKYGEDEYYRADMDTASRMYASVEWMKENYLKDERETRPFVLCEYAHAMGNGPGGLQEYVDTFEGSKRFMGGFIWEWADHGVAYGAHKSYRYGGDFGERMHDGNFCMDGIVTADRQCKAGTLQMKKAYQPIVFTKDGDSLVLFNKNYFSSYMGTLKLHFGDETKEISVCIAPRDSIKIPCDFSKTVFAQLYKEDGSCNAWEQFYVDEFVETKLTPTTMTVEENADCLTIKTPCVTYALSLISGEILQVETKTNSYGKLAFNIWRAPVDNDKYVLPKLQEAFAREAKLDLRAYRVEGNALVCDVCLGYARRMPILQATITYTFFQEGVEIGLDYEMPDGDSKPFEYLMRIGWKLRLDTSYTQLKYLAYDGESYSDLYEYARKGEWESTVSKQYYPYAKPQECGSHYGAEYVEIANQTDKIRVEGMRSFSVLPYSPEQITDALHHDELPVVDGTYVCVDYAMSGVGSAACGPNLPIEHQVSTKGQGKIRWIF